MLGGVEVDEGIGGLGGLDHGVAGADAVEIAQRRPVGAHHQMVAVVEVASEAVVVKGAAAPAGLRRRLIKKDVPAAAEQGDGGRQPGQTGADYVDGFFRHHHFFIVNMLAILVC